LDSAHLADHFYIGFVEYVMVGRENGAQTCAQTKITIITSIVGAVAFDETVVI